jgi:VanZ family protein
VNDAGAVGLEPHGSPFSRIALAVYVLLTAYASLYPLEGWREHAASPFEYLSAEWPPRYVSRFDMGVNVLGYVPLGWLCVAGLYPRIRGFCAFAIAVALGGGLSVLLEAAQTYLPTRDASNLDVACNTIGAVFGALLGWQFAAWTMEHGPLKHIRNAIFLRGAQIDFGLVLIALWLFVQLNPAMLLFGAGSLRDLVLVQEGRARAPEFFVLVETLTSASNIVAVGLLLASLIPMGGPVRAMFLALIAAGLVIKAGAFALLMRADSVLGWLTPGAQLGLVCGLAAGLAAVSLPRTAQLALAAVLLMAATVLVNLAPPNPYFTATLKVWQQGHFLNFNGLTRIVSSAWPYAALAYLIYLAARRPREAPG